MSQKYPKVNYYRTIYRGLFLFTAQLFSVKIKPMSWMFILFINVVAISISTLFQRLAMKEEDSNPVLSTIIFQFLLGCLIIPFAISQGFFWPSFSKLWPYFLFSTTLYALGSIMFFKSIKLIEASEMIILSGMGTIVTMLCAYVFLQERLVVQQYLGALLVIFSILLVQYKKQKFIFGKGALFALAATSLFAFATISDVLIIRTYNAISYAGLMSFFPGLMLCLMYFKKLRELPKAIKTINKNLVLYALMYSVGVITFYSALAKGALLSQVGVIGRSNIILTVILAAIFIKERDSLWRKVLAAVICMVGVILVA